ncbi:uncharacterized protein LOC132200130 [Neocloeon triangulifer]|uniref:uncharacterized protein LOC132200130 n=1 Tax=Neocloeon triangulifer TaxID=2078957 RepID=UPI00286F58B4|nr:uncharacterized protein LOC132200130 [Neocloeon triangulifer]XP_059481339.1 uncharacterized protein LOC132200130 [Neocloeon triangulifer]
MELAIRGKNNDYIIHRQQQALLNHYDYPLLKTIFLSTPVALLSRRRELLNLFSADKPVEELARLVLTLIVDRKGPLIELRVLELLKVLPEDVREKVITVMLLSSVDTICKLSKQFDSNNFKRRQSAQRLAEIFACICKNRQDPCLFLRVLIRLFEKALLCDRDLWYIRLIFVHAFKAWPFVDSKLFEECINTNQEKFSKAKIHILIRKLNDAARDCDNAVRYGILIALNNDQLRNFANSCLLPMAMAFMQNPRKSAWAIVTLAITCCLRKDTYLQASLRRAFETFKRHSTSFVPLQVSEAIVRAKIFLEQNSFIKMDLKIPQHAEYIQLLCKKLETQKLLLSPAAFPLKNSVLEIFNLEYTITENLRSLGLQAPEASVTLHCLTPDISCSSTTVKKEQNISHSPPPKQKRPSIPPDSKRPLSPSPPPKLNRMSSNKPSSPAYRISSTITQVLQNKIR